MKRVLLDFDGVTSQTFVAQLERLNIVHGTKYSEADFVDWATELVLSKQHGDFIWNTLFTDPIFQLSCKPTDGILDLIKNMNDDGDFIVVVSDRPLTLYNTTKMWLKMWGLYDIPVIFTRNKTTQSDQHEHIPTKADVARDLKLTHVLEDSGHNALSLAEVPVVEKVWLLDKPHNQTVSHPKIERIHTWSELYACV